MTVCRSFDYEDDFENEGEDEGFPQQENVKNVSPEATNVTASQGQGRRDRPKSAKSANSEPQDSWCLPSGLDKNVDLRSWSESAVDDWYWRGMILLKTFFADICETNILCWQFFQSTSWRVCRER